MSLNKIRIIAFLFNLALYASAKAVQWALNLNYDDAAWWELVLPCTLGIFMLATFPSVILAILLFMFSLRKVQERLYFANMVSHMGFGWVGLGLLEWNGFGTIAAGLVAIFLPYFMKNELRE